MPELFEITAFATILTGCLSMTARSFTLMTYPDQGGINTFTGLELAGTALGPTLQLALTAADIVAYGKELIIRIHPTLALICHFALHGHAVTVGRDELELLDICRTFDLPPFAPLIFRANDSGPSLAIIDRNKIARLTFLQVKPSLPSIGICSPGRGPCPIKQPDLFIAGIRNLLDQSAVKRNHAPIAHYIYTQ